MSTREEVITKIAERLASTLGKDAAQFNESTTFAELPLKSANYSQITTFLEDAFDVEVSYMEFKRKRTVGEAADYITELVDD